MIRSTSLRRLAAGLLAVPVATLLATACGTGFTDGPGFPAADGAAPDAPRSVDASRGGTDVDGALFEDGSPDAHEADAGRPDAELDAAAVVHDASADVESGSAVAVPLGAASGFAVLAGSTVTIAPVPPAAETFVTGDVGTSPNATAIGVFSAAQPNGQIHAGDAVSLQAEADLTTAYDDLFAMPCLHNLTGTDLGTLSLPLPPGVYCFDTSVELTGTLTLDAQNDPNAVWVFQIGSTLTTAATNGDVTVIHGTASTACHVYWAVGSSATLNTGATFLGNVVTLASITMTVGVTLSPGRALARNGAVTLEGNTVSQSLCQ